jgi:hypothetical protein
MEDTPQKYYEENPYQANAPRGGEKQMSVVRAALTLSLAIIISAGMIVLFLHHKDRFIITPQNKGVFVFDNKNSSLSFCTNKACTLISVNADRYPSRETSFMPQSFMGLTQQQPLGFMSPNAAMQQNPLMTPNMYPQNPWSQGFGGFQNQQPLPMQQEQTQQQQVYQDSPPLPLQNNFAPAQQYQGQQDQGQQYQDQQDQGQQQYQDQGQEQYQDQPDQGQQYQDQ